MSLKYESREGLCICAIKLATSDLIKEGWHVIHFRKRGNQPPIIHLYGKIKTSDINRLQDSFFSIFTNLPKIICINLILEDGQQKAQKKKRATTMTKMAMTTRFSSFLEIKIYIERVQASMYHMVWIKSC